MNLKLHLPLLAAALVILFQGCTQDTFTSGRVLTPEEVTPSNLLYADVVNAREYSLIKTGLPTVETGGVIPAFEITEIRDGDGEPLGKEYTDFVSIVTPKMVDVTSGETTSETIDYKNAGVITIEAGNPFSYGTYSFDIRVTTEWNGTSYSTLFTDGLELKVGPALPSALLYIPMAQNLVVGAGSSTTRARLPSGNPAVTFSLGSETDKLVIDPQTGVISLASGYSVTETVTLYPTVIVTSTLSGEEVVFEGSSDLISVVVSTTPVDLPLQEKYFFTPSFQSDNIESGYRKFIRQLGLMLETNVWRRENAPAQPASERPEALSGNYSLMNNPTVGNVPNDPHESWLVMAPQNLSDYADGFDVSATFWVYNQYVAYLTESGLASSELRIKVSTDFNLTMANPSQATWTDVTDRVLSQIFDTSLGAEFTGLPYPGDNNLTVVNGSTDNDRAKDLKDPSKNANAKWTKARLDLTPWKTEQSFTLAFHHVSNFTGQIEFGAAVNGGRMGRFQVSDVYYKAVENPE